MSEMKELKEILLPKVEVKIGEQVVEIKRIPFGKLPEIADLANAVISKIQKNSAAGDLGVAQALFEVMKDDFQSLIKALIITTSLDRKYLEEMSLEVATFVITNVVEVNADFLSQKVMPQFATMQKLVKR